MSAVVETILYQGPTVPGESGPFEGVSVHWADDASGDGPRPLVLVVPNVFGIKDADIDYATRLARLGYACFIVDMYGAGKRTKRGEEGFGRYMEEMNGNRALLRDRIVTALDVARGLPDVDPARVAAVGFCFGGLTVLDLARSGADVAGVVSLHGVFTPPGLPAQPIKAEVLVCHGWDDPLCPPEAFTALAKELTEAGCAWRAEAYGHTGHSFTDPETAQGVPGFGYSPAATAQAFTSTTGFLERVLG